MVEEGGMGHSAAVLSLYQRDVVRDCIEIRRGNFSDIMPFVVESRPVLCRDAEQYSTPQTLYAGWMIGVCWASQVTNSPRP